ncbi:hypothetical protein [Rugamonas sp.]|uniref:hypothetical protein n=1 Tax=Rugamonas sp. TaxID=1926287 RepID=UPI0025FFC4FF|nr:hypothetical protein [Rugamonas sp.]
MEPKSIKQPRTAAAIAARWGLGTPEQRWQLKINSVIQFVARLGWATVEMVNYHLDQSKRDWVAQMVHEKWFISKLAIIDDRPATILVLTHKAQRTVKQVYPFIGRRIDREASRQSRHDFIASWAALWLLKNRHDLKIRQSKLEIWTDRVMRGFIYDEYTRPDISIMSDDNVLLNIEVERTRKSSAQENYQFFKKLEYFERNGIENFLVFESRKLAARFSEEMQRAKHFGLTPWFRDVNSKRWCELRNHEREIFDLKIVISIWDYDKKIITDIFYSDAYFQESSENFV